jgi:hypothetical protein
MPFTKHAAKGRSPRWVNDAPQKRFTMSTLPNVLSDWKQAWVHYQCEKMAARYAIFCYERRWHSGSPNPNIEKGIWKTSCRIDSSPERLRRLIHATLHIDDPTADILESLKHRDHSDLILEHFKAGKFKSKHLKRVAKMMDNYVKFCGYKSMLGRVSEAELFRELLRASDVNHLLDWDIYSTEEDFAVLGKFSIPAALKKIRKQMAAIYPRSSRLSDCIYLFHPDLIIHRGLGDNFPVISLRGLTNYFKKYPDFWQNQKDPIGKLRTWIRWGCLDISKNPETNWIEAQAAEGLRRDESLYIFNIPRNRQREAMLKYSPIAAYRTATKLPFRYIGDHILSPATTNKALERICAELGSPVHQEYLLEVQMGSLVAIVATDRNTGESVAMGTLLMTPEGRLAMPSYGKVAALGDTPPSPEVQRAFAEYLSELIPDMREVAP